MVPVSQATGVPPTWQTAPSGQVNNVPEHPVELAASHKITAQDVLTARVRLNPLGPLMTGQINYPLNYIQSVPTSMVPVPLPSMIGHTNNPVQFFQGPFVNQVIRYPHFAPPGPFVHARFSSQVPATGSLSFMALEKQGFQQSCFGVRPFSPVPFDPTGPRHNPFPQAYLPPFLPAVPTSAQMRPSRPMGSRPLLDQTPTKPVPSTIASVSSTITSVPSKITSVPSTITSVPSKIASVPSTITSVPSMTITAGKVPFKTKTVSTASATKTLDPSTTPSSEVATTSTATSSEVLVEPHYDMSGLTKKQLESFKRVQSQLSSDTFSSTRHERLMTLLNHFRDKNRKNGQRHQAFFEPYYNLSGLTHRQKISFHKLKEKWMHEHRFFYSSREETEYNHTFYLQQLISSFRGNLKRNL